MFTHEVEGISSKATAVLSLDPASCRYSEEHGDGLLSIYMHCLFQNNSRTFASTGVLTYDEKCGSDYRF